jgi:hypothetical protein
MLHRARDLCDFDGLHEELVFLGDIFRQNGYSDRHICRALNPPPRVAEPDDKPHSVAFLAHVRTIFNRFSRGLSRQNITSVGLFPRKISCFLRSVKDKGMKTPGAYSILCECYQVYSGQTGHSTDTRMKEHHQHIRLQYPEKSALAEPSINLGQASIYTTPSSSPPNPDTWIALSGRRMRLNSIQIIRTERMASI